jgi:alkanesulfonate monooxygenase SsuD/methylene tetrahydromethanopterin reductase-like flavin-dependent oxidoreductase (luciferase family)
MKFFLAGLGNWYHGSEIVKEAILEADKVGFDGALLPDHYMWGSREPSRRRLDDYATLDSWIFLTYLAAKTEQIHLGTRVTPIPFRPPGMLAKMVSTVDILSNDRTIVGVGAGWSKEEFEGYSQWNEPKIRVNKTIEGLDLIVKLWTQNEVTFEGKYYRAKAAVLEPKPLQKPYPPLLFGSRGDRMLRLAGQYGNICFIPNTQTSEEYEERKKKVLKAAEKVHRIDKIAFMAGTMSEIPYDPKEYSNKVEEAIKGGASYFQTSFPRNNSLLHSLRRFAQEIIHSFK